MRKLIFVLLAASLLLNIDALADTRQKTAPPTKVKKSKRCVFPNSRKSAPIWVCTEQDKSLAISAVGSFAKSEAGNDFMLQMAAADARTHLVQKMSAAVQKQIVDSEAAANKTNENHDKVLINKITSDSLEGSKILKKTYDPSGKLYVLVGLDEAGRQKLQASISAKYLKQKPD